MLERTGPVCFISGQLKNLLIPGFHLYLSVTSNTIEQPFKLIPLNIPQQLPHRFYNSPKTRCNIDDQPAWRWVVGETPHSHIKKISVFHIQHWRLGMNRGLWSCITDSPFLRRGETELYVTFWYGLTRALYNFSKISLHNGLKLSCNHCSLLAC